MAKATGFEDDTIVLSAGSEKDALELSDREQAIAKGLDPDEVGADEAEEEGDEAEGTEAESKEDAASGDEEGKDAAGSDWVDDDVKSLAESYGIDEDALASFESEADFKRFATIYEKHLAGVEEKPAKKEPQAEKKAEEPDDDADAPDVKWFEDNGYDEQTVKIVKSVLKGQGVVKGLLGRIEQLEQRIAAGDEQREKDSLHREIDSLGGRFGKSDSLTSGQKKARGKLIDAIEVVKQTLAKRGEKVDPAVVLKRAEFVAFGDEILAEEKAKQQSALSQSVKKQSAKRRSVGRNTKPPARRERPGEADDPVKAIANSPEVVAFWNDAQDD